MRRLVLLAYLGLLFSPALVTARDADTPVPEMKESIVLLTSSHSRYVEGRMVADAIADLRRDSPTFNEMLRILGASRILTFITPLTDLRTEGGFIGQTRFVVGTSKIVALVQVVTSRSDVRTRREAIAHELAHIVEVACLGPVESQGQLRQQIRLRMQRFSEPAAGGAFETQFPLKVTRVVLAEARDRRRGASQLGDLLTRERLMSCPSVLPGRDVLVLQRAEEPEDVAGR